MMDSQERLDPTNTEGYEVLDSIERPDVDTDTKAEEPAIEGQPVDWEKEAKEIKAQYTKLTTQIAEDKKADEVVEEIELDDDKAETLRALKEDYGLMTKKDYQQEEDQKQHVSNLDKILQDRPELLPLREDIITIGKSKEEAWEDIIARMPNAALSPSDPGIVGDRNVPKRTEGQTLAEQIKGASKEEFAEIKRKLNVDKKFSMRS